MRALTAATALVLTLAGCGASPLSRAVPKAMGAAQAHAINAANFFANAAVESQAPGAFAAQAETVPALRELAKTAPAQREALVSSIRRDPRLVKAIANYPTLTWEQRLPVLKQIQALEAATFGMKAPPLTIDTSTDRREAYFRFDPTKPGTGEVILYPRGLATDPNPYASLLLLIHETRHSFQFQTSFAATNPPTGVVPTAFRASFQAQLDLGSKLGFCDFCTLLHEHEAFETGNYVVGALTNFTVDTKDMGCYSSQFDKAGKPKIDLLALVGQAGPAGLLDAFNLAEQQQFRDLGGEQVRKTRRVNTAF